MIGNIMYLISNAFRIYVIARFYEHFFSPRIASNWIRYLSFCGYFILNSGLFLIFENNFVNLFSNVISLFLIGFLYSLKWQNRIIFPLIIYGLLIFIEGFFYNICCMFIDNETILNMNIETNLILYLIELLLEHKQVKISSNYNIKALKFLAIILVVGGSLLIGVITMQGYSVYIVIVTLVLLSINIVIFSLYDIISKSEQELYEKKLIERQNDAYNNQIKIWEKNKKATQMLRHDMKNHLMDIKISLENKQYDKLEEYISQLQKSLDVKDEFIRSGNISVDSMLNYKIKEIQSLTDNIIYNVSIPCDIFISNFDFNIILGNLLDNSIEALSKCDKNNRKFNLQMIYNQGMLKISISNSYSGIIQKKNNTFKTTKKDTSIHGIGIESIKNTIQKYNGIIDFYNNEELFQVKIVLCNDKFQN